jgi:hypothetical protein
MPFFTHLLEHGVPAGLLGFIRQDPSVWQVPIEHGDTEHPQLAPTLATFWHFPALSGTPVQHSLKMLLCSARQAGGFGNAGSTHAP